MFLVAFDKLIITTKTYYTMDFTFISCINLAHNYSLTRDTGTTKL